MLKNTLQNTPNTRNTLFSFPKAGSSPGPVGTAGFPTINARTSPPIITDVPPAGTQNNGSEDAGGDSSQQPGGGNLPISQYYINAVTDSDTGGADVDAASEINAILRDLESGDSASEINAILKDLDNPLAKDYKIKKGDNLTKIAKENNTTVAELLKENPKIKNPNLIYAGETIKVPTGKAAASPTYNNTDQDVFNEDEKPNPDLDADVPDPDLDEDI
jgi:LysM repeat protein